MEHFISNLMEEIGLKVEIARSGEDDILRRSLALSDVYREPLARLREFASSYTFRDEREEIRFFKEIKPWFLSRQMFHRKVYSLEIGRPVGASDVQTEYLRKEMSHISEHAGRYADFCYYYRSGATYLDKLYFLRVNRDGGAEHYRESFDPERDPGFSTLCDFKAALLLAGEMILKYLNEKLEEETARGYFRPDEPPVPTPNVPRWTDKKAGLIEMLYGWDSMGSFENGQIPLAKLQKFIERHFEVSLGNISRAFNEMKIRNNPTPFLDSMKEALIRRMDRRGPEPKYK